MLVLLELAGQVGAAVSLVGGGLAAAVGVPFFAPAMLGAFAGQLLLRPDRLEAAATVALAAVAAYPLHLFASGPDTGPFAIAATALGAASLVVLGGAALRLRGSADRSAVDALLPSAILPAFALLSYPMVYLTVALWPTTWDHRLYLADLSFGAPLSFVVGRAAAAVPLLAPLCLAVYVALPLALLVVHALRRRADLRSADAIVAFVALTTVGWLAYQLVPVAGPVWAFGADFPMSPPDPASLVAGKVVVVPAPRNCMPSLHSAWALLVWWLARPLPKVPRVTATVFLAITLLATVALGFHYVVDLVAAFPLTTAVQAWATTTRDEALRRRAIGIGALLTLAWMALATWGLALLLWTPLLPWTLAIAVVGISSELSRRIHAARVDRPDEQEEAGEEPGAAPAWQQRIVAPLVALSAVAVFVHWAITANALGVLLGSGASVRVGSGSMLLAAVAAGLASAHAARALPAMLGATLAAVLLAATSAVLPTGLRFVALSSLGSADFPLNLLSAAPLLVSSGYLFGLLAGFAARSGGRPLRVLETALPVVALAALATAYVVLPSLYSSRLPAALHALAAVAFFALAARERGATAGPARAAAETADASAEGAGASSPALGIGGAALCCFGVGLLAGAALETIDHLRTVAAGNTVHARAHAVVAVTVGAALGAAGRRLLRGARPPAPASSSGLAGALCALAASVALLLPLWPLLPGYFASFREYAVLHSTGTTFAEREFVRLALAALLLLPSAACAGAALAATGAARDGNDGATVSRTAALLAGVAGGFAIAGFALVPFVGSAVTLKAVAAMALAWGLVLERNAFGVAAALAVAGSLGLAAPLDLGALASGNGLVFAETERSPALDAVETVDGIVAAHRDAEGRARVSVGGRMRRPAGLAKAAAGAAARNRALLLGLGTGEDARALVEAGFDEVLVAESDEGVVRLAVTTFAADNGDVLRDPRLRWSREDGRRALELGGSVVDVVAIDVPEASAPGAAALMTREAYAQARRRLAAGGLLVQHLDLAELSPLALGSVLAGARTAFEFVALEFEGRDALLVAADEERAQAGPGTRASEASEESGRLSPPSVGRLLEAMAEQLGVAPLALAASDRDLFLAHEAPRTVTRHGDPAQSSLAVLRRFADPQ
jgi:hypothetical protein